MSSAIAALGGPSLTQWVRSVTKRKAHRAASNTPAGSTGSTGAQGISNAAFLSQVQQAVTTALQSAQADGASDPNQIVEDAITKLLKNMGVGSNSATASTNTPANSTVNPSATAPSDSANQAFASLLQSMGISPQQFQADFQAAVKDAQRGSANPNAALRSIPIGSTLDVTG